MNYLVHGFNKKKNSFLIFKRSQKIFIYSFGHLIPPPPPPKEKTLADDLKQFNKIMQDPIELKGSCKI